MITGGALVCGRTDFIHIPGLFRLFEPIPTFFYILMKSPKVKPCGAMPLYVCLFL